MKKYFKTIIQVEVLSEDIPYDMGVARYVIHSQDTLEVLSEDIRGDYSGDYSGIYRWIESIELSALEVAKELRKQGSSPKFFDLDEFGNELQDIIGYQVEDRSGKHEIHPHMEASFCIYSWSQCVKMILDDTDHYKIVPVYADTIEDATFRFEGDPYK